MNQSYEILNSKLSAPGVAGSVARKRLEPLFSAIPTTRITVVTAGAGFGKSTAIAQACDFTGCNKVWYRLDSGDADSVTFVNYIVAGIKKIYPDFGEKTLGLLNSKKTLSDITQSLLTVLVNEIDENVADELIIVLDDCHEVADSKDITSILQFFADHFCDQIHIVMISRIESSLSLSKYRTRLEVNEICQHDLEFTVEEISALFRQLLGVFIPENSINKLCTRTEGWAAGLILYYHLSKGMDNKLEDLTLDIKSNHKIFREYLGENVFEGQPDNIRDFLIRTSIFKRINVTFCNRFLGIDNAGVILSQLEKNHLFTTALDSDGDVYAYHHLFQEFLKNRLENDMGSKAAAGIHYHAAQLFESFSQEEDSLYHYLEAKKYNDVFRLLKTVGYKFFNQGRHTSLDALLKKIPEQFLQTEPSALLLKAKLYSSAGQLYKAAQFSKKAHSIYTRMGLEIEAEMALVDLGRTYFFMGDFFTADETFMKILQNNSVDEYLYLEIIGTLVFTSAYMGKFEQSDAFYKAGQAKLELFDPANQLDRYQVSKIWLEVNYAFRFHFIGDFSRSTAHAESVYYEIEELASPPLTTHYCNLVSVNYMYMGKNQDARNTIARGFKELHGKGFQGTQEAWLRMSMASICLFDKAYEEAIPEINKALEIFRLGGSKWGEASTLLIKAVLYEKTGEEEKAKQIVFEGLQIVNKVKLPWVEGKLYTFSAIDMMKQGDYELAESFLKHAEKAVSFSTLEICMILVIRTKIYIDTDQEEKAIELLVEALAIGEKYNYGSWVFFNLDNYTALYVKIFASGKFKNYLIYLFAGYWKHISDELYTIRKSRIKKIKNAATEIINQMPKEEAVPLVVNCLGTFRVFTGDKEITGADWKSNKAREIFKYLIFSRNKRSVPRDVLLELLWPEQDYDKTIKRLHVALPALRKTLEPDVRRGESSYLVRENDLYRIDFKENGFVDADLFIKDVRRAETEKNPDRKLAFFLRAESWYCGDLFAEDIYTEWCYEERENLKREYLKVLENILSLYENIGANQNCIRYAEKYLEADVYAEEIYLRLMGYYFDAGNAHMALKTYEKCHAKIVEDLDCPMNEDVQNLYNKIVNN